MASINLQGDTSGAITISAPSVAGSNTLTLPATTQTLATQNALGVRNLIINGDMRIAQRGTTSTSNGYQTVDRWAQSASGVAVTQDQVALTSSDSPYSYGLKYASKLTNTSTSTATNAYVQYRHRIEAQNMAQSGWNYTDSSSSVTLSFWIKSSVSGQYYGYVKTDDGTNKRYNFPFDLVADTWKKVTVTIPGHSDLQFDNDNGIGLQLYVYAYLGTDYTDSGALTETWETYDVSSITPNFTSNWNNTASATMFLTGIQLEVGDTATPFEQRPYDMELARCKRYYTKVSGTVFHANIYHGYEFSSPMRTTPSMTLSVGSTSGIANTGWRGVHTATSALTYYADAEL